MRLCLVVVAHHPLVYYKLAEALFCGTSHNQLPDFSHSFSQYKLGLSNLPYPAPAGMFVRALLTQLRDLWNLAGFTTQFRPLVQLHDATFRASVHEDDDNDHWAQSPILVFTMDTPTCFAEPLMLTLRSYLKAGFDEEFSRHHILDYEILRFVLPRGLTQNMI